MGCLIGIIGTNHNNHHICIIVQTICCSLSSRTSLSSSIGETCVMRNRLFFSSLYSDIIMYLAFYDRICATSNSAAKRAIQIRKLKIIRRYDTAKSALQLSVHDFQQGVQAVLKGNRHKPMRCTYPARTLAALIAVTAIYIVPFIIDEQLKMFYYRGLSEWPRERGYLMDTCLTAQDIHKKYLDYFRIPY